MKIPVVKLTLVSTTPIDSQGLRAGCIPGALTALSFKIQKCSAPKKKPFLEILELIPRAPTPPIRRDGEVTQRKMVKQHRRINESSRLRLAFAPQRLLKNTSMICMQELRMKCFHPKRSKSKKIRAQRAVSFARRSRAYLAVQPAASRVAQPSKMKKIRSEARRFEP